MLVSFFFENAKTLGQSDEAKWRKNRMALFLFFVKDNGSQEVHHSHCDALA